MSVDEHAKQTEPFRLDNGSGASLDADPVEVGVFSQMRIAVRHDEETQIVLTADQTAWLVVYLSEWLEREYGFSYGTSDMALVRQ